MAIDCCILEPLWGDLIAVQHDLPCRFRYDSIHVMSMQCNNEETELAIQSPTMHSSRPDLLDLSNTRNEFFGIRFGRRDVIEQN